MKARWRMKCECCKAPIEAGSHYVVYAGRPWLPDHLLRFKRRRR